MTDRTGCENAPTRRGDRPRPRASLHWEEIDALQAGSTWWRRVVCWSRTRHVATVYVPWLESCVCRACGRVEHVVPPEEG